MREHARLLSAFIRRPMETGAVAPSSHELAELMVADMGLEAAQTVVELGPGTGVFTRVIQQRVRPEALVLAFEINPALAEPLVGRFPRVRVINDSADRIDAHIRANGRTEVDCILSGLPWAAFPRELQERLLGAIVGALRPGGRFATFAYVPAAWFPPGRRFRAMLESRFSRVATTPLVWRNVPPAFVYRCER